MSQIRYIVSHIITWSRMFDGFAIQRINYFSSILISWLFLKEIILLFCITEILRMQFVQKCILYKLYWYSEWWISMILLLNWCLIFLHNFQIPICPTSEWVALPSKLIDRRSRVQSLFAFVGLAVRIFPWFYTKWA